MGAEGAPTRSATARVLAGLVGIWLLGVAAPGTLDAQVDIGGYALGVGAGAAASDFLPAGSTWLARTRLMADAGREGTTAELAYEHVLQRRPAGGGFGFTSAAGSTASTDWLPLDWTLHEGPRGDWRHRFDRLAVTHATASAQVTVGRQTISWATTLFLTPADPFAPFDPSDPFREYRGGVDAVRARYFTGPFTEFEAVLRPTETPAGTTTTALARAATSRGGWAFGGWAGLLHDEPAGAAFASGSLGTTSLRAEAAVREDPAGGALLRGAVGLDHYFRPTGRDLFVLVEIQFDGFGAARPAELIGVATSAAYARGELQTLGRVALVATANVQIHPLVAVDALALVNAQDGSVLVAPGVGWSVTETLSARGGLYLGAGATATSPASPGSEYGSVPTLGYVALSAFF